MSAVWAITRLTLLSAARRRTPLVLILLAVVLGPALSMFLEGDLRLEGLIKTVLTWNIAFIGGSMMLLTVFFAANLLGRDIVDKQMFMVDSKPVRRWQIIIGKWLGLTLLVGWLLLLAWGATFVVVYAFSAVGRVTMGRWGWALFFWGAFGLAGVVVCHLLLKRWLGWRYWGIAGLAAVLAAGAFLVRELRAIPVHHDARAADMTAVRQRLLVSRRSYRPAVPDLDDVVARRLARIEAATGKPIPDADRTRVRMEVLDELNRRTWRIPYVGTSYSASTGMTFRFRGVPVEAVKYAPELVIRYTFLLRRGNEEGGNGWMYWRIPTRVDGPPLMIGRQFKSRAAAEVAVPASVILNNGEIELQVINHNPPHAEEDGLPARSAGTMYVPLNGGLEVLVPVGRFDVNLARGFLLLWIRMAMIALVGVAINTLVSGPVTALALCAFLTVGTANNFLLGELNPDQERIRMGFIPEPGPVRGLFNAASSATLSLAPNFEDSDPVPDLVVGREIPWSRVAWRLMADLLLRGGLAAAVGIWVFSRRELAKPTAVE